jgi:hypothetical protein
VGGALGGGVADVLGADDAVTDVEVEGLVRALAVLGDRSAPQPADARAAATTSASSGRRRPLRGAAGRRPSG